MLLWKKKTSKVVHLKTQRQWILFHGKLKNWDWTLRRDTPAILRMHLVQNWIRETKRAIWRNYPNMWTSWAKSLRAQFGGTTTWWNLNTRRLWQQSSVEFGEKICKFTPNITLRFIFLWRRRRHRSAYDYCIFRSVSAQCCARRIELRYNWILWGGPTTPYGTYRDRVTVQINE